MPRPPEREVARTVAVPNVLVDHAAIVAVEGGDVHLPIAVGVADAHGNNACAIPTRTRPYRERPGHAQVGLAVPDVQADLVVVVAVERCYVRATIAVEIAN